MSNMLKVEKPVEGINVDKIKIAMQLLRESGLPPNTLASITNDLATDECPFCRRHWPCRSRGVVHIPPWRYSRDRLSRWSSTFDRNVKLPAGWYIDFNVLKKYKKNGGIERENVRWESGGTWTNRSRACEPCAIEQAVKFGKDVAALPKKELTSFLRMYTWSLPLLLQKVIDTGLEAFTARFYIAFTNALMQNVPVEGNKKAWLMLVDCGHALKML